MQDVNHQVSKALATNNPKHTLFVLEDLSGVRSATEHVRTKNRYVSVSCPPFYDLEHKLIYKAKQKQSTVIKVNPRYTSQCCANILKKLTVTRSYICLVVKTAAISQTMPALEP